MEAQWESCLKLAHKASYLMAGQELAGIGFDKAKAEALTVRIREEMQKIEDEIHPQLPPRALKKQEEAFYTMPKKPYRQDGSYSELMVRFAARHEAVLNDDQTMTWEGTTIPITGGKLLDKKLPMELSNQEQIKDYLLESGWQPTLWNLRKDKSGKPIRDDKGRTEQTSAKLQENGRLCPNLEEMSGPLVKPIVKWLSYRNRLSVLEGWLANPRLEFDGRLTAGSSGIANTFRQRHTVVCNVPKNKEHVLLGKEMRELYIADEGMVFVGYDASSLEDRIKGHLTYKYDNGAYAAKILAEGYDPHQENADLWGIDRSIAKNGTYALGYFCGVGKLATTIKCSKAEAEKRHKDYWDLNDALRKLDEALGRHWEANGKKYIIGLDGRKVFSRHRHGLVNLAIQSSASIIMDFAGAWMDRQLGGLKIVDKRPSYLYNGCVATRVLFMHDEYIFSCQEQIAQDIVRLGKQSIQKAGEFFKLHIPLKSTAHIDSDWSMIH